MTKEIKNLINHDNAVMNTFLKEYNFYTDTYNKEIDWYKLRNKVDLRVFYKVMNVNYNYYRYFANEFFLESLQEPYRCNR